MRRLTACTSVLVGKKASIDGSTMIARNDDTFRPLTPQRFFVIPAQKGQNQVWVSNKNGFRAKLPQNAQRYLITPNADVAHEGVFGESGFNEKNVAMSATESVYGNERALACDPWIQNGLAEDSLQSLVLPYIDSAKDGVKYLGKLIAKYGSPEGNGVLFADQNDVWYMEIVTGHQWVAERIPDDAYAICANEVAIQQVDFNDPKNFMWAPHLQEFVKKNRLNPDKHGFNFRHIFGTFNQEDRCYNTPRVWYGQHLLNPEIQQSPTSPNLPFICHTEHKICVEDVEKILGSHYNETPYDPFGKGSDVDRHRFRPIAMNRTQNSHVLQVRNDVPADRAGVMWLCFGVPAFAPYVPFIANTKATDPSYEHTPLSMDDKSAYWMYRKLSMLVESHYAQFAPEDDKFLIKCRQAFRQHVAAAYDGAKDKHGQELTDYFTKQNQAVVKHMRIATDAFCNHLMSEGLNLSKLTFRYDKNL